MLTWSIEGRRLENDGSNGEEDELSQWWLRTFGDGKDVRQLLSRLNEAFDGLEMFVAFQTTLEEI